MSARRFLLFLHFLAAAVSGGFLLVLGVTGSILVFEGEIDHWLNRSLVAVAPGGPRLPLQRLVLATEGRHPGAHVTGLAVPGGNRLADRLSLRGGAVHAVYVDPYTAAEVGSADQANQFLAKVHQFHTNLLLGPTGKTITVAAVMFLLFLTLSGLVLWARRKIWRWRGAGPRVSFSLHNVVGFYAAPFLLLFAATGMVIHWDGETQAALRRFDAAPSIDPQTVRAKPAPGQPLDPDRLVAIATGELPGAIPSSMQNLGGTTAPVRINLKYPEDGTPAGRSIVLIHPVTGEILWRQSSRTGPLSMRVAKLWNREIHTGDIAGWPTRVLACVASLGLALLVVTGPFLWWARHRKGSQGRTG